MGTHRSLEVALYLPGTSARSGIANTHLFGRKSMAILKSFLRDESGATAIEYGLIASLIAVAIIVGAGALGTSLNATFDNLSSKF